MSKIEEILKRNGLRWLGHVHKMEYNRFARQAMEWAKTQVKEKEADPERTGELPECDGNVGGGSRDDFWIQDEVAKLCCPKF